MGQVWEILGMRSGKYQGLSLMKRNQQAIIKDKCEEDHLFFNMVFLGIVSLYGLSCIVTIV
ncbi:MAG TPA: hypothetical protein ACQGQH_08785 [Xylella sp.]